MSRRRWFALLVCAVLTVTASATVIRFKDQWPPRFIPTHVGAINVLMDIGYWVDFINFPDTIRLQEVDLRTYQGRLDVELVCNFCLTMECTIAPTGTIPGQYSCWLESDHINPPGGTARLFVRLENANLAGYLGGTKDVHVATVTVRITPRV